MQDEPQNQLHIIITIIIILFTMIFGSDKINTFILTQSQQWGGWGRKEKKKTA